MSADNAGKPVEDDDGGDDTDWLSAERIESKTSARDRLRRSRVRKAPQSEADDNAGLDLELEDADALDEALSDLDDDGAVVPEGRDADKGVGLGTGDGWLEVEADPEGQQAVLTYLDVGGDAAVDAAQLTQLLADRFEVRHGVDTDVLEQLLQQAREERVEESHVIATATPAEPGRAGQVKLLYMDGVEDQKRPAYVELSAAFDRKEVEEVLGHCPLARLVAPGTAIATIEPPTDGTPGTNVFGDPLVEAGAPAELTPGKNVRLADDGYQAEILGYAYYFGDRLAVVSPLWLTPDRLEAHFILFPLLGPPTQVEEGALRQLLENAGVRHGIQEAAIERLCNEELAGREAVLVARGVAAVHGVDTHVEYDFDPRPKPGVFLQDGTIDLKQRNTVITVAEGQYLGQLVPATKGQGGITVTGEAIEAKDGQKKPFKPGRNLRIEEEAGGGPRFFANIQGSVRAREGSLSVEKVYVVEGDVDYSVGNIDTISDVEVAGSLKPGFTIKSAGSVVLGGVIEPGATVQAGGDVVAAGGIVGDKTRVVARGGVEAKYIQNSSVLAQGDIHIGSYIINGNVRCGGRIVVHAGGDRKRGGSIVGGQVISGGGIDAMRLGSELTDRTLVGVRGTPTAERRQAEARKVVAAADKAVLKILRTLGITKVNAETLKQCIASTPRDRRREAAEMVRKLQGLVRKRQEAAEALREIGQEIAEALKTATIHARMETYPDVMIQIGEELENVPEKVTGQTFYRGEEGIAWRSR